MPISAVHPSLVCVWVLRTVIQKGASTEDFHIMDAPNIQASEYHGPRREIDDVSAFSIDTLAIDAGAKIANPCGVARWRLGLWRIGEKKQHLGASQMIARTAD